MMIDGYESANGVKIIRRDLLGKTSACKTLKKTDSCEAINEDCAAWPRISRAASIEHENREFSSQGTSRQRIETSHFCQLYVDAIVAIFTFRVGRASHRCEAMGVKEYARTLRIPWFHAKLRSGTSFSKWRLYVEFLQARPSGMHGLQ